jgi:hypothetical protein
MERDLGTSRPRIMVVGTYNQKYDELAQLTIESNFRRYCSIHNYSLWSDRMPDDFERAPQWRKIKLMIELLKLNEADWLFFVDCDCLFMNMAIKVESLIDDEFDIIVSRTSGAPDFPVDVADSKNSFLSGQFLVKNSENALRILQEIWEAPDWPEGLDINQFDHEMRQMRFTLSKDKWKPHVKVIEEKLINRFWPSRDPDFLNSFPDYNKNLWEPGDFIVHVTGCSLEERIEAIEKLKYFTGGLICKWGQGLEDARRIYFTTLEDLTNVKIVIVDQENNQVATWFFESLSRRIFYWVFFEQIDPKNHTIKCYSEDYEGEIACYKFSV